jgi:hypothetical protein
VEAGIISFWRIGRPRSCDHELHRVFFLGVERTFHGVERAREREGEVDRGIELKKETNDRWPSNAIPIPCLLLFATCDSIGQLNTLN